MTEPVDWSAGAPRSPRFDDTYFSLEDGLAESRAVFLDGCGLPERWAGRRAFTVAELGFGTGLNILALLELWRRTRPAGGQLFIFSTEAYPISVHDARTALAAWPDLAPLAAPLLAAWPDGWRGWRRIEWPEIGARLDLAVAEVADALDQWSGAADAWFLDGFAPSRNPEMWRDAVMDRVRDRSAPGARISTFTVAGGVRRALSDRGFQVTRQPGFGRKKQRLEALAPGPEPSQGEAPSVAVIGAGVSGAALVRAFRALGVEPRVFESAGAGAGASGNPAALVTPRLDAGLGPVAELYAQAFARATALYEAEPSAVIRRGALQLAVGPRDPSRFDTIAGWDGYASGALTPLSPDEVAERLAEPTGGPALAFRDGLVIEPQRVLEAWLGPTESALVTGMEWTGRLWRLLDSGRAVGEAEIVVIAAGHRTATLAPDLPLRSVRGQITLSDAPFTGVAAAWGGYAIPTRDGLLFGATHGRDDDDVDLRREDDARNLAELARARPRLAADLTEATLGARAAVRAATPDHMPIAGELALGLFVLSGLGGRGFTLAPILAEQVAALVLQAPRPLPERLERLVRPSRFRR